MDKIQSKSAFEIADEIGCLLTKIVSENWVRSKPIQDAAIEAKNLVNKLKARLANVR